MTSKIRVAFVDDEPHILHGIRRSMTSMEDDWDMEFCSTGEDFLKLAQQNPFDVIVSDMRMPGMDGAQLLDIVRSRFPATVRIILSGYADTDSVMRTIGPAHMYLAKPCDADLLQTAIIRQISLRSLLDSPQIRSTLSGLQSLPSLPKLYMQLQAELRSLSCSAKSVADIISQDVAMTAEIMKLTNSAYFSASGAVTSPMHAVRLLGMETVQALALRVGIFRQFSGNPRIAPLLESLTHYSLRIAALAERIALAEGADLALSKGANVAAMLSDIGSIILFDADTERYEAMLARTPPSKQLHLAEEDEFGASHAVIGAYLLGLWGFSDDIVEAVAYGYTPTKCPSHRGQAGDNVVLTAVHVARFFSPPSPLLPKESLAKSEMDIKYLIEVGRDGHIPRWRDLAKEYNCGNER